MDRRTFVARLDGWLNLITGLGVRGKDKRVSSEAYWNRHDELFFEHLYASDGLATRIVNLLPEEACRKSWSYSGVGKDQSQAYLKRLKALNSREKLVEAWKQARKYGGAAILYLSRGSSRMDEPMLESEEVTGLQVLGRFELQADFSSIDMNPLSPHFRLPTKCLQESRGAAICSG